MISTTSDLPHVHIDFTSTDCVFTLVQARAGISISYNVVIDEDVPGFLPNPYPYGPDVSGLDIREILEGGAQSYCRCDEGYPSWDCPLEDGGTSYETTRPPCAPVTLMQGVYKRFFTWDGVNWKGPSDTLNPKGAPFPAGDYTLTVSTVPGKLVHADGGSDGAVDSGARLSAESKSLVRLVP